MQVRCAHKRQFDLPAVATAVVVVATAVVVATVAIVVANVATAVVVVAVVATGLPRLPSLLLPRLMPLSGLRDP